MSGNDNTKKKTRRLLFLLILVIAFVLITAAAIYLIFGSGFSQLTGLFSSRTTSITANEFSFEVGRDRSFSHMGGSLAAVGTLGVQVLDAAGRETLRDSFRMSQPAIASSAGRSIAFDIGGSSVRVFNEEQITTSIETEGAIVSASINRNGWFCVVTQEGGGLRGSTSVYNNLGAVVYRVNLGSGFILSAQLSHDNRSLAVLNLTDTGSRINFYHGIDEDKDPDVLFDFRGGLIIDIMYLSNGDILAVSTDSLFIVSRAGDGKTLYSFADNRLGGYARYNDFIALHLYDHGIGFRGRLITLLSDGTILGEIVTDREVISMSAIDRTLIVLKSDGLVFYNEILEELPLSVNNNHVAGATRVLAASNNVAIATSDNSAVVIRANAG